MKEIDGLNVAENLKQNIGGHFVHYIQRPGLWIIDTVVIDVGVVTTRSLGSAGCSSLSFLVAFCTM
jgi:hypothetical protein